MEQSDRTIPPFMAEKLYAAAPEPKQIALIPQANHNNLVEFGGQQYLAILQQFMQRAIGDRKFTPNSKINYSPSPQVPKSPSPQVPSPQVPKSPSPQVPKSPSPQVPKSPSPQVPKSPSPQVPKSPSPQVPKFPSPQVPKFPSPQVPKSPSPQVIPYHPRSDATPNHHVGSS